MALSGVANRVSELGAPIRLDLQVLIHALALVGEVLQVTEKVWRELLIDLEEHILQIRH